jgi:GDPmannose 4,6-dehydratase
MNIKKTALICGINGQDGTYLADYLLGKNYEVWGTARDIDRSDLSNLTKLSILDKVTMRSMVPQDFISVYSIVQSCRPDEIYYLAGQSSVGLSFEQPVETIQSIVLGTLNFLEVCRLHKTSIRFYNAGSGECFGNCSELPANEMTSFDPQSPYAVAKASAYWLVKNYRDSYGIYACT